MRKTALFFTLASALVLANCVLPQQQQQQGNTLTHSMVTEIKKGVTTQAEILESFGAPNITTTDASGQEVWTYQRAAQSNNASARAGGIGIFIAGILGSSSQSSSSSRMMTIIIKFDSNKVVSDFRSRSSNF